MLSIARFTFALFLGLVCFGGTPRAGEDPRDAPVVAALVKQTLEFERTGADLPWSNPETGSSGVIRVKRTYYLDSDTPCRDYIRTTRRPDGEEITTHGSGCRMGDGRWFLDEAAGAQAGPPSKAPPSPAAPPAGTAAPRPAAAAPAKVPETGLPPVAATPKGETDPPSGDKPAGSVAEKMHPPPVLPRAKPKVLAPQYTLPSKSAL